MTQTEKTTRLALHMRALARDASQPAYAQILSQAARDLEQRVCELEKLESVLRIIPLPPKAS
jgi:hypothetical protein